LYALGFAKNGACWTLALMSLIVYTFDVSRGSVGGDFKVIFFVDAVRAATRAFHKDVVGGASLDSGERITLVVSVRINGHAPLA
jgi:hypothetical protein